MNWHWVLLIILTVNLSSCNKKTEQPHVDVFGHAGSSLHRDRYVYPANTFESVKYAIDVLDADGVEIDIQMTKDSVLVLFHDPLLVQSSSFPGCIQDYNFEEIENLSMDYSPYKITKLKPVVNYIYMRKKWVYLGIKTYNYCEEKKLNESTFQYALNEALSDVEVDNDSKIILGMTDLNFLKSLNFTFKCFENNTVEKTIQLANENNFKSILFHTSVVNETNVQLLKDSGIYWGMFGVKDEWTIDAAIQYEPNFLITDNIARTKKVTN